MGTNTSWAIVLSVVVIGAFMLLQPIFFAMSTQAPAEKPAVEKTQAAQQDQTAQEAPVLEQAADTDDTVPEQSVTITTDKVRAVFTNKGGDIVSYELLSQKDTDTGKGVEMADNISGFNRACAVSFGGAENSLINDKFIVEQPDQYTVLFTKHYNGYTFGKRYTFK